MKRVLTSGAALAAVGVIAWQAAPALQNATVSGAKTETATPATPKPAAPAAPKPQVVAPSGSTTPMADRVAVLGLLNKRNGLSRDLTMKPGQAIRIGDVVVRLQACETTPPWENEQLTGAFVQVVAQGSDKKWRKHFSGWLFKESPSLNVVEHPIYDVWTKSCTMRHMDTGKGTTVVRGDSTGVTSGSSAPKRSSAPKSAPAAAEPEPEAVADDNSDI
jgi:hypothetical protein